MLYGYRYSNNKPRTYSKCLGVDGKEYIIRMDALTSGATKNITGAMTTTKELEGQKLGLLTALYPTDKRASNGGVIWHCRCDCGNECDVTASNLIRGHSRSCGCNHQSKWAALIEEQLRTLNVEYEPEKRFQDCRNLSGSDMLPFDFYIPSMNKIIEYDGEHHFMPVKGWGGEEKFKKTKENDEIKNRYCERNNIELLRIPYTKTAEEIIKMVNCFVARNDHTLEGND